MDQNELTMTRLVGLLTSAAGVPEGVDLEADVLDVPFEELGYDSLALLETSSLIERGYGVKLDESVVTDATTPRLLLAAVNRVLAPEHAA